MGYSLVLTAPPVGEPVSLALLKTQLRIPTTVTVEDALLTTYLTTARQMLEEWTQRAFITQSYTLYLDFWSHHHRQWGFLPGGSAYYQLDFYPWQYWWQHPLTVPKPPLQTVTSIQYYDQTQTLQTLASSTYSVDTYREPGRILLQSFPALTSTMIPRILVNFTAGYGTASSVPAALQTAILLLAADLYRTREALTDLRLMPMPTGLKGILDLYRISDVDPHYNL